MMSGFGYWAHDIGGFENTSTADVYKRWVAFGLLSSHSRLHGSSSYRVPWVYDEEAVDVVRFFTRLKAKLMPYLYKTAKDTSQSGIPTMRSMVLEYPEDKTCHFLDKQYMLGDSLLVAPIFNEEGYAEYYLPAGIWTDFLTGEEKQGGRWITEKHGYLSIPLLARENSIIALGSVDSRPDYDYTEHAQLRLYALQDGQEASTAIPGINRKTGLSVTARRNGNEIKIHVETGAETEYTLRLINTAVSASSVMGLVMDGPDSTLHLKGAQDLTVRM